MLKSIHLKNFQIHNNTTLELHPRINVIVGESEHGKSSITRAINLAAFNRPPGTEYITHGKTKSETTLCTDAHEITRLRDKKRNQYIIDGKEFHALKTDVPEEVSHLLNLSPTNIQFQDDLPFLLSLGSSDVAKKLNMVVGLEEIDLSIQYTNKIVKAQKSKEKHISEDIKNIEKKLKKFERFDYIKELYQQYDESENKLIKLENKYKRLSQLITELDDMLFYLNRQSNIDRLTELLTEAMDLQQEKQKLEIRSNTLSYLMNRFISSKKQIELQKSGTEKVQSLLNDFEELHNQQKTYQQQNNKLKSIIKFLEKYEAEKVDLEKQKKEAEEKFKQFKKKIGSCPTCGQSLSDSRKK